MLINKRCTNNKKLTRKDNKKGQMAIFVIIAIVIIVAIAGFFVVRSFIDTEEQKIDPSLQPVYKTFKTCAKNDLETGINILESRGGYIELPDFESGSRHMPFSSQLDFMGTAVPYWYYVSGNGIKKEQIPSESEIETQLANYVEEEIKNCEFEEHYGEGFKIDEGGPEANVMLKKDNVELKMDMKFKISKGNKTELIKKHDINVNSKLKELYEDAKMLYQKIRSKKTLEKYARDTLRLYAPVDGADMTCSPKIWKTNKIFDRLEKAIESNTAALKARNNDYSYEDEAKNKYFSMEANTESNVRFLNSQDWPHTFKVDPSQGGILKAEPVGNQPGMGILGFCYVNYHFVYNIKYPVMVQLHQGNEIFQFPYAVVVEGNTPGMKKNGSAISTGSPPICKYKNTEVEVSTYTSKGTKLVPVDTNISFETFGKRCDIGDTSESPGKGKLKADFPQSANGFVIADSPKYERTKKQFSTIESGSVDILLDKLYERNISLSLGGKEFIGKKGRAIITFMPNGSKNFNTVSYPQQKKVKLAEGQYKIRVRIFKNSSVTLEGGNREKCVEVPQSGLGSMFGLKEEKCYDIEIPDQKASTALAGGGTQNYYILESQLKKSDKIEINAPELPEPTSLKQIQENSVLIKNKGLTISFGGKENA